MFRMQMSAGLVLIDGLLAIGFSQNEPGSCGVALLQGGLSIMLGLMIAYRSCKR